MSESPTRRSDQRTKIVEVAARLLQENGPSAVTTRGVAEAAGVQAPAIYRLFGDKDGLLDAVAEHVMSAFVAAKAEHVENVSAANVDPLDDLRAGWAHQIDFGLANPALFRLLSNPDRVAQSPAAVRGRRVLEARIHRVALIGRLRVSEERAADIMQAAGIGTLQSLLATPDEQRDTRLADSMYEAVLAQILTDSLPVATSGPLSTTVAFRAVAPHLTMLSEGEQRLLGEWLDRVIHTLSTEEGSTTNLLR